MTLMWIDLGPNDRDTALEPVTICIDCGEDVAATDGQPPACACGPVLPEHL